jgi:predicted DsbA family dithiol-disulfide isomerase
VSHPKTLKIDFVSDVSCPWCVIGLGGLEQALAAIGDEVKADVHFQPFELNPGMAAGGQNIVEHIAQKYGASAEQSAANRAAIKDRAAAFGFTMAMGDDARIYNTFDAHRLLHWAGEPDQPPGAQAALKRGLFEAYFTRGQDPGDIEVLAAAAEAAGLDANTAREVLTSGRYADAVRSAEARWQAAGVTAVPAVIINDRYLISGGQPPEIFEQALRQIAAEADSPLRRSV